MSPPHEEEAEPLTGHGGTGASSARERAASTLAQDRLAMVLLFVLYTLQGIPMGLSASIPFLLQSRVTYKEQAVFSLVSVPFSLKLLWAPIVDGFYSARFGRRKSWLVPIQLLCGATMVLGSSRLEGLMGDAPGSTPDVGSLARYFGFLFFLMATQDIAVDGWALTMLSPGRVAWAGTINTVGQTLGYFTSYVGFLALNDEATCNAYLRGAPASGGLVSLSAFVAFWGWVFIGATLLVLACKAEGADAEVPSGVLAMYREALECARLPPVRTYALVLLTVKLGSAAADAGTSLKLTEYGMPKEELAFLSPFLASAGIIVPMLIAKLTTGPRPLSVYLVGVPARLLLNVLYWYAVPLAARAYGPEPSVSKPAFYAVIVSSALVNVFAVNMMFVSQMAFANRVADPSIGGTYITLINTVANLGGTWTSSVALYVLDSLTTRQCTHARTGRPIGSGRSGQPLCETKLDAECTRLKGACEMVSDGYRTELLACTALGIAWLLLFRPVVLRLQATPINAWRLRSHWKNGSAPPARADTPPCVPSALLPAAWSAWAHSRGEGMAADDDDAERHAEEGRAARPTACRRLAPFSDAAPPSSGGLD